MEQRRKLSRWQINRQAKIKLEGAQAFADCQIKDINLKGLQISLGMKLPRDSFLKFCIFFAQDCVLDIEAWVVWHKTILDTNTYGLYFTRVRDNDKEKIYRFVHKYCPEQIKRQYYPDIRVEGGEIMQKSGFEDRRIFERFFRKFPVRFLDLSSNREGHGQTQDISAKGVSFTTDEQLRPHATLELWLRIPDQGEPLYTRGEVVWANQVSPNEYRAGVNLERADLMGLSRVLRIR